MTIRYWIAPMWSSWPCVRTIARIRLAFSFRYVKSGRIRSIPCMLASGNISPQSMSIIVRSGSSVAPCSMTMQLRPISPSPPRNTMRTGVAGSSRCGH